MTEPCVSVSESLNSVPKKTGLIPRGFLWHRVDTVVASTTDRIFRYQHSSDCSSRRSMLTA